MRQLCESAVEAALAAGAEYADARAVVRRSQAVSTKNGRVENVSDVETEGIGVRVLVGGAWGFACDRRLDAEGARGGGPARDRLRARVLGRAQPRARAGRGLLRQLPHAGRRSTRSRSRSPTRSTSASAPRRRCGTTGVVVTQASVRALREHKVLFSSDGVEAEQELVETGAGIDAIAANDELSQLRSYPSAHGGSSAPPAGSTSRASGSSARRRASASRLPRCSGPTRAPAMVADAVIDSEQMALQVHESVGHPTELDRVYGTEASYAGTSFLKPADLGTLRYGSEQMNVTADPTTPRGLGTFGFDDEGVLRRSGEPIVERRRADAASSPRARPPLGSAPGAAATCAPRAGAGCRSCG